MQDTRNNNNYGCAERGGTVCIDTKRVLDSCRDKDCFEDVRVYLTAYGEEVVSSSGNVRTKNAEIIGAYVGIDEVPFNDGFYKVTVKYYVRVELEVCQGIGKSVTVSGISVLEKDVVLFGGTGNVTSYTSGADGGYCSVVPALNGGVSEPEAIVEVVEPVVLGTKVKECLCGCCCDIPDNIRRCVEGEVCCTDNGVGVYVSFGIFSTVRIQRNAQLLIQATDYCVPDKECHPATTNTDPCELFRTMAFPVNRFNGGCSCVTPLPTTGEKGCGCSKNR